MTTTRTGKIARLPAEVRTSLNRRLLDGEPGTRLVAWLNAQPAVQAVLAADFGGRPVSPQNLSEWKQGGYKEWRRHRDAVDAAGRLLEGAGDYEELADGGQIADRLTEMAAVALGQLLVEATQMEEGPARRQAVLGVVRELSHLRRADRAYERACRDEELHERASAEYLAKRKREIEAPVEGELRLRRAQYLIAQEKSARCVAARKPVPATILEFLNSKDEFDALEKRWRNHVVTYGSGAPL